jgi:hypothetical protein
MTLCAVLMDVCALAAELLTFERTYGRRSETCSAAYVRGEEPADDQWVLDFGEWPAFIVPGLPDKPSVVTQNKASSVIPPA